MNNINSYRGITPMTQRVTGITYSPLANADVTPAVNTTLQPLYRMFTGTSDPDVNTGSNGDWYLKFVSGNVIFYQKTFGSWVVKTSLA